jgi:hypothetical protein
MEFTATPSNVSLGSAVDGLMNTEPWLTPGPEGSPAKKILPTAVSFWSLRRNWLSKTPFR